MRVPTSFPRTAKLGRFAGGALLALVRYLSAAERADAGRRFSAAAPQPAVPEPAGEALLLELETSIRLWEVEYRRFLHGERSRPPAEIGAAITAILEEADAVTPGGGEVFRLESLEARFATSHRRFSRLLAARERTVGAALRAAEPLAN